MERDHIPNLPFTNYIVVHKKSLPVQGVYVLDLSLPRPPLLHPRVPLENRQNLVLHTTKGAVTADVWFVHNESTRSPRVSMTLGNDNGFVHANLHDPSCRDANEPTARPSLDVAVHANHGDISLTLPHCFRGPVTIHTTHERITFSPALEPCTSQLSDVLGERVYFVGERPRSGEWRGGDDDEGMENTSEEAVDRLHVYGDHTNVCGLAGLAKRSLGGGRLCGIFYIISAYDLSHAFLLTGEGLFQRCSLGRDYVIFSLSHLYDVLHRTTVVL